MKVLCINDKNKPTEIPNSHWIKEGELYTILDIRKLSRQNNILGISLEEIDLESLNIEYKYFKLDRFAININDLEELKDLIIQSRELAELDELNIQELIEEQIGELLEV